MPLTADGGGGRVRLDRALVQRGLAPSRAQARDLIKRGLVELAGKVERRTAAAVAVHDAVVLVQPGSDRGAAWAAPAHSYVSRGAHKLAAALEHFGFPVAGVVALDIGASTGGFSELMLERGARRIYAVDVGRGQLHARLARLPALVSLEGCDARRLDTTLIPEPIDAIVADVSFISLTKALPAALTLARSPAWLIALIKPQFEAGRATVGKGGIVRDPGAREAAIELVRAWLAGHAGWQVVGVMPSPIAGGSGNQEFLIGAVHGR